MVDPETGEVSILIPADEFDPAEPDHVWFHLRDFGADPAFTRTENGWLARLPPPPVDRLEYLISVRSEDGTQSLVLDPTNPLTVAGVFGDHSVLELPGYAPPEWCAFTSPPWESAQFEVPGCPEGLAISGELTALPGTDPKAPLPLLVVHDGPEYAQLARLGDYLGWLAAGTTLPPCRVLLLRPEDRNLSYAANLTYASALTQEAIPLARQLVPVTHVLGLGASLGALSLAHAAATHPGTFAGLHLQSGSFFLPTYDAHEVRFRYFPQVVAAVAALHVDPAGLRDVDLSLTVGQGEENLENNRAFVARMVELGVTARIFEARSGHSYTAWRDLLHPGLGTLLARCATPSVT